LQTTLVVALATIFSNAVPQSRHLYSKSGISASCCNIAKPPPVCNPRNAKFQLAPHFVPAAGAFSLAFVAASAKIP
jgi:hypothetical protein